MMSDMVNNQAIYLEMAMQLLQKAGLHPELNRTDGEGDRLTIVFDALPVAVIRRRGEISIGVVEIVGRDGDG